MDHHRADDFSGSYADDDAAEAAVEERRIKPDGKSDPAGEAGWYLQRERERRGLALQDAGIQTSIHPYHIQAIEYGDMTHMPPRMEALEMIAAYADFLGFDPEPLLHHYVTFLPPPQMAPRPHPASPGPLMSAKILAFGRFRPLPPLNFRLPSLPPGKNNIVASVAAAFMLFSGATWMLTSGDLQSPAQTEIAQAGDPMPTASTGLEAADVQVTETPIAEEPSADAIAAIPPPDYIAPAEPDGLGDFIAQQIEGTSDPQTVAAVTPPELPEEDGASGRIFGANEPNVRVTLKANKAIWLLIEDGQGNRVATQLLNPGDMYRVPNREGLVAIAQDGGALIYMIDGAEKGVLGTPGALLAAEPLDVKKLEAKG